MEVVPIAEARAGLSRLLADFRTQNRLQVTVIGSHRKPEAVLVPYRRYQELIDTIAHEPVSMARLRELKPVIERLARASHLTEVRVYGSVARGGQTAGSDLDLIVTPDGQATLLDLARFESDLELILQVPVSAVSLHSLDESRDHRILAEAVGL